MKHALLISGIAMAGGLAGCKPPPTDAAVARATLAPSVAGPSTPLPSPDTAGAVWATGAQPLRLVYGVPGQPVLLTLECLSPASADARLKITRHAPADAGASALLALVGREAIGRFEVDSTPVGGQTRWQGEAPARAAGWNAFMGPQEATATVPGAGLVRLNPSPLPFALVEMCRGTPPPPPPPVEEPRIERPSVF